MIEFSVIHKAFLFSEEKIGSCLFKLHIQTLFESELQDFFFLKNEKDENVGKILIGINLTGKEIKRV
jgi:hypothetical protein